MNQDWRCANCGESSCYQGHYGKLPNGEWGFTCKKLLRSLEASDAIEGRKYWFVTKYEACVPTLNGIACPECGEELYDSDPGQTLTSHPPKKRIHCSNCTYNGTRIA